MKKYFYLIVLLATPAFAGVLGEDIGPATSTSNVTIAAPGVGKANCLTFVSQDISVYGSNTATLRILAGGTTVYQVITSTTNGISSTNPVTAHLSSSDPLCGGFNESLQIKNTATTFDINYKGYVKKL